MQDVNITPTKKLKVYCQNSEPYLKCTTSRECLTKRLPMFLLGSPTIRGSVNGSVNGSFGYLAVYIMMSQRGH